jgi:outer membrane biosynthesis protein TonB
MVKLSVLVNAGGKMTGMKGMSGNHALTDAAKEAVRKWRFESGNGAASMNVLLNFSN